MSEGDRHGGGAGWSPADLSRAPGALQVRRRPVPVQVDFAVTEQVVHTLEGPVPAHAGDAIVTGTRGERWPVSRARFDAKYDPVPPLPRGQSGRYSPRPLRVWAVRMEAPFVVPTTKGGMLQGRAGDWLLDYGDGSRGVVADAIFQDTYEPA